MSCGYRGKVKPLEKVSCRLEKNIEYIEQCFDRCDDVIHRKLYIDQGKYPIYIVYIDSMIDRDLVEGDIIKTLIFSFEKEVQLTEQQNLLSFIKDRAMLSADISMKCDFQAILTDVLSGNTVIFGANAPEALVIDSKNLPSRGVPTAETEVSVRGSKDSFNESLRQNTLLIRKRIRDTRLKTEQMKIGRRTQTDVALLYMDDLVQKDILSELKSDLDAFDVDAIFDSGNIEQYMEHRWLSPFPQFQATERPDKAASAIMEGRIVLIVDNSPMVIMTPTTLNCFFQAADDYYYRWEIASFTRIVRYLAACIAIGFPGFYVAAAIFHPEIFPTSLALSITASRQGVPFPLAVEIILMELAFELLREAGIRLPGPMGSTLSIVGGLIIGQAAVDAHIVSPVVVIVVALTALASFAIPNDSFASAFRFMKFMLIILGAFFGLAGFVSGVFLILVHLASLESYGIPYLDPYASSSAHPSEEFKDSVMRYPLFTMRQRPIFTRAGARIRFAKKQKQKNS